MGLQHLGLLPRCTEPGLHFYTTLRGFVWALKSEKPDLHHSSLLLLSLPAHPCSVSSRLLSAAPLNAGDPPPPSSLPPPLPEGSQPLPQPQIPPFPDTPAPDFCPSARSTPPVFPRVCGHPSGDSSQTPLSRLAPKCRLHAGSLLPRWALMRAPFQPHCHCLGSHPDRLCPQLSYGSAYLASTPTLQVQLRRLRATGIRSILPCCCRERGPGGPGTDQCLCPKQDT